MDSFLSHGWERLFKATPCFLTVQDSELRIIAANDHFRKHFGRNEGRHCYNVYKRRSEACEGCPVERSFRDQECHTSEQVLTKLNDQEIAVIVYTTPIIDEDGQVRAVMEMSTDITEIKRLQLQLRRSQERYRLIFDEVPCFISIQDRDLGIVDANRRFQETFGRALGRKCYQVYKQRDEQCLPCAVQQTFADGQVNSREEIVTSVAGKAIHTLVYTAPMRNELGDIISVMEMSTDITPIRELQSQLEQVGVLISSISHGIKGLLTGLDGGIYLVNSGLKRDDRARLDQGWEMVQRNVDRIRDMVLNLLYYAKEREPSWETLVARELLTEALALVATRAEDSAITLEGELALDAGTLEGDAKALRTLLVNLLENSLDACRVDNRKEHHAVSVNLRGDEESITIEIADNGIGMDRETRNSAFNLFFSAKGMEGTGLGLFISNKIVTSHGGTITVESEPGEGTRFTVVLPRRRPPAG